MGCILGQALGDALGFVVEAHPPDVTERYVREQLLSGRAGERSHPDFPFGQYSDDTQLARELLLSVVDAGGWRPEAFGRRIAALFGTGRAVGAGEGTRGAAARLSSGIAWTESGTPAPYAGNGSAMRAAPLGVLFARDVAALTRAAEEQSRITHRDPRCAAGAIAVAGAVRLAGRRLPLERRSFLAELAALTRPASASFADAVGHLAGWADLPPAEAVQRLHTAGLDPEYRNRWQGISAFVIPSVVWSLYAFLHAPDDYWTCVCTAIAVGGDTDTMAAIAGAMAGARLGPEALPAGLVARLNDRGDWGADALADLAHRAARLVDS